MKPTHTNPITKTLGAALLALAAILPAQADYESTVLSQSPLAFYRLGETVQPSPTPTAANIGTRGTAFNGQFMLDVVRGAPGALVGDPGNTAVRFPGVIDGNRVRVPFDEAWNPTGPFSVEFWAKPGQTNALQCPAASVEFIGTTQRNGWLFYQGDTTLTGGNGWIFRHYNNSGLTALSGAAATLPLSTDQWYHVVGVYDGTNIKLYVNGTQAASSVFTSTPRPISNSAIPLTFGARADGASGYWTYKGSIDEAAVYPVALTPTQIQAHYEAGTSASPATPYHQLVLADAPTGYWRLAEPADPVAVNLGTLGAAGDGSYLYASKPGQTGPQSPDFPGMGAANKAVQLDGASGYVAVPALNLTDNAVTITAWVKPNGDQLANAIILACKSSKTTAGLRYDPSDLNGLTFDWSVDGTFKSSLAIPPGQWSFVGLITRPDHVILCLHDGTQFRTSEPFYFDSGTPVQPFDATTCIGSTSGDATRTFNGLIDEVAFFNRMLTIGEVYTQYGAAAGNVPPTVFGVTRLPADPVYAGDTLTVTVDAGGTPPLSYQWRKGGVNIAGAQSATYSKAKITTGDSGNYDCVVSNGSGTAISVAQTVTVNAVSTAPYIVTQPVGRTLYATGSWTLAVQAEGGALEYQWKQNGNPIPGATDATYSIDGATADDTGTYVVEVSNSLGSETSIEAVVEVIVPAPGTYAAAIVADAPVAWWRLDDTQDSPDILDAVGRHDGVVNGTMTRGISGALVDANTAISLDGNVDNYGSVPFAPALNTPETTLECWVRTTADTGEYIAVSTYESKKGCFFMRTDVADGLAWWGGAGHNDQYYFYYSVMGDWVSGKWTHLVITASEAEGYRWYRDGELVAGPFGDFVRNTSGPLRIGGANTPVNGAWNGDIDEVAVYSRVLTPDQIRAHYNAAFGASTKPAIVSQPQSTEVVGGANATFSVSAEGSVPLSFQWSKDGTAIDGATASTLTITAATEADEGAYTVVVTNPAGSVTSEPATLTVVPLRFTSNPISTMAFNGDSLTLSVAVESVPTPTLQWRKCGVAIPGATGTTLTLNDLGPASAGEFTVVASNTLGSGGDPPAVLTVLPVPTFCNLTTGLVLHLPFDGNYQDSSGRGNHAAEAGSPVFVPGKIGTQAFKYNTVVQTAGGVTTVTANYLSLGKPADLEFGTSQDFSVSYWVRFTGAPGDLPFLCNAQDAYTNPGFTFAPSYKYGGWSWGLGDTGIYGPNNSINDGQWHHLVHTFDRTGNGVTYLDGMQVDSRAAGTQDLNTGLNVSIGQDPTGQYPEAGEAELDDLAVWRRVLTPYEAACMHRVGLQGVSFDTTGAVSLTVLESCGNVEVLWHSGTLEEATDVNGSWSAVTGAAAPSYRIAPTAVRKFYRVKQ